MSRRVIYYLSAARSPLLLPLGIFETLLLRASVVTRHHGVAIANLTGKDPSSFVDATRCSLDLIQERAPVFFRRIQRHVAFVANSNFAGSGMYLTHSRAIKIDFSEYWSHAEPIERMRRYSLTLVHEAAHAHLHARHFPYIKATRARIEHLCVNEQNRFVRQMGEEWRELYRVFSEDDWRVCWHGSRWEKVKLLLERAREEIYHG